MKFGSLFTGVGGFDLGFERAGMECVWQVEFDKGCQSVLRKHWSETELFDDVRTVGKHNLMPVDVICGGFPCQDVSIAGKRAGLAGERSGLWSEFARIIDELEPKWVVIENVPGLLSSNKGRDFATVIRWLAERGYGVCWRVLDSQYFGVAQRRRRVFIVGSLRDGRAVEVLFEREGGGWNTPPSRAKGEGTTAYTSSGFAGYRNGVGTLRAEDGDYGGGTETLIANCLTAKHGVGRNDPSSETFLAVHETGKGFWTEGLPGLRGQPDGMPENVIAWHENKEGNLTSSDKANALRSGASHSYQGVGVRRLTPTECERLQSFPDGWTGGQADSHRYKQIGNAVTVNVAEWIAKRINQSEQEQTCTKN